VRASLSGPSVLARARSVLLRDIDGWGVECEESEGVGEGRGCAGTGGAARDVGRWKLCFMGAVCPHQAEAAPLVDVAQTLAVPERARLNRTRTEQADQHEQRDRPTGRHPTARPHDDAAPGCLASRGDCFFRPQSLSSSAALSRVTHDVNAQHASSRRYIDASTMHGLSTASSPYKVPKGDCLGSADNQNTINNGQKTSARPGKCERAFQFDFAIFPPPSSLLFYPPDQM
jgi:hypothetical protein